ncbi:ABC transporter permease [Sodalis ligni]|uniref:ABC-type nitrate/sulfonate/bicarbonate transport system permease component n=1 Tax=Sodalis ligni TaxID=2697027 RepID=A0A4V2Q3C5_9GAMM|nr:ABC transporter permease [Sodalis ligni]TCL06208.1 ABC-type nitrate/sulfonate/bicarbonate transport system permease component [Sodalis ligni]
MNFSPGRRMARGVFGASLTIGIWLLVSFHSQSTFFPPLHRMLGDAWSYWFSSDGLADMRSTLGNLAFGLIDGVILGVLAGLAIGQIRLLSLALTPLIEFVRAIPSVALLPVAIGLMGIGDGMKIAIIAFSILWPVLINTVDGVRHIPGQWLDTARVFHIAGWRRQCLVVIPALMPRILAGINVAIPLSLVIAVTSEMIGTTAGIGSVVLNAQYTFDVERMWSGVLLLGVIGALLSAAFAAVDRVLGKWDGGR